MRTTITKILLLFGAYCIPAKLTIAQTVIKLDKEHNEYTTPCVVNGLKLKLEIATANFEVGISQVEATFMIKNGYIKESDVLNSKLYETASGEIAEGAEVTLREINISGLVLHDVKAIVIGSERAPLLIGQNALSRLGKITLDYNNNTLTIGDGPNNGPLVDMNNPHGIQNESIDLVHVEGGSFSMGSDDGKDEETPKHTVKVKSFSIGKYEITVGQFRTFVEATNYRTAAENEGKSTFYRDGRWEDVKGLNWTYNNFGFKRKSAEDYEPVLYVTWYDAQRFCEWMSAKTGKHYRLPTEAEWEYAAKGGLNSKQYKYSGSNEIEEVGWVKGNAGGQIRNVGLKKPNELDIYDMTGNVLEYCSDWFDKHYYQYSPLDNPKGPEGDHEKVSRGGGVYSTANESRTTDRHWDWPNTRCNYNGFRVAVDE